ncbi:MAG: coniferyl-alcohol dehydrogenase [Arenibacterium sp.]
MEQKTYAITGVSNGIGKALARILKTDGHRVIGFDIASPSDPVDQFISLDLSDPASIKTASATISDGLDGLCNCAGLPPRDGLEARILDVNFFGTRAFTKAMQPHLNDGASVVNLASRAGHRWHENLEQVKRLARLDTKERLGKFINEEQINPVRAYDLSKEAVILWTMASSEAYLNRNQRVNSVSPGAVETGILQDFENAFGARMTQNVARAGRAGTPEEIAHLAAFLLSPQSSWIKGVDVSIDGGMSAFNTSDALELSDLV